jgi:hypothetical protein
MKSTFPWMLRHYVNYYFKWMEKKEAKSTKYTGKCYSWLWFHPLKHFRYLHHAGVLRLFHVGYLSTNKLFGDGDFQIWALKGWSFARLTSAKNHILQSTYYTGKCYSWLWFHPLKHFRYLHHAGVLRLFHVGLFHTVAPLCNSLHKYHIDSKKVRVYHSRICQQTSFLAMAISKYEHWRGGAYNDNLLKHMYTEKRGSYTIPTELEESTWRIKIRYIRLEL